MFMLAHLSDPHLSPLLRPGFFDLIGKRALGFVNWHLRRREEHRIEILDALLRDLAAQRPDHVAVTGDLVNIALPGEFAPAREFLGRVGPPDYVTFVPGNHDAYVRATLEHSHQHWGEYMAGDARPERGTNRFPFIRRRGGLAFVGLSTAIPTGPFRATGRLGREQLERLEAELAALAREKVFRVVLLHHPPFSVGVERSKRLLDAEEFRKVIRRQGADLVLHGHIHVHSLVWLEGPDQPIPCVGVPSASASGRRGERAGYNLYRIGAAPDEPSCELIKRGLAPGSSEMTELGRDVLTPRLATVS